MARKSHVRKSSHSTSGMDHSGHDDGTFATLPDPGPDDEGAKAAEPADVVTTMPGVMADGERSGVGKLRREVRELKQLVGRLAAVSSMETVIINGFSQLSTQLQPLRSLEPTRGELPHDSIERLRNLRAALKRPQWRGSDFSVHEDAEVTDSSTF